MDTSRIEKDYPELAGLSRDVQIRILRRAEAAASLHMQRRKWLVAITIGIICGLIMSGVRYFFPSNKIIVALVTIVIMVLIGGSYQKKMIRKKVRELAKDDSQT